MMVGPRRKCERCREDVGRVRGYVERIRLLHGPDGERLCQKHHREVWTEYMECIDEEDRE